MAIARRAIASSPPPYQHKDLQPENGDEQKRIQIDGHVELLFLRMIIVMKRASRSSPRTNPPRMLCDYIAVGSCIYIFT